MRLRQAGSLGTIVLLLLSAAAFPAWTAAQEASGTPVAAGEPLRSITRDEYVARFEEEMGFAPAARTGGDFIGAETSDIQSMFPLFAEDDVTIGVVGLVYQGLIGIDLQTGQPAPTGLADSWEIAPDRVTYTFHLNRDARWHDGTDVTAADVQFSFDALADPDVGSSYTQSFLAATESWRVVDDDTFAVVAREPLATFLYSLVTWIVPRHVWADVPVAEWRTDGGATGQEPDRVVGSGPFHFQEWRPGERVTLVRNDDFFGKAPYLESYSLLIWPDQISTVNALRNGVVDAALLAPADVPTVEATEGLAVTTYPTTGFTFYLTNLDPEKTTLFQDARVRRALLHALDREAMARDILLGSAQVAQGTQPAISYAFAPDRLTTRYDYDPERAEALLAEAGWTDGDGDGILDKDGEQFSFELIYRTGSPIDEQQVTYMQDAWRAIGVDVTPRALEFPALVEQLSETHDFEMAMLGFGWDASFIQDLMFGCAQYEGGFNAIRYCNPEVDALNAAAMRTFDEEERRELLIAATDLVNEDLPVAVLHFTTESVGYSDRLRNFVPTSWGNDMTYVWIEEG
jgi:peptide/nickel transport system substrate-binding protein